MKDYALIASAYQKSVRIYAAHTTNLVEHARKIHQTWPTATAAFGRFLTVSALMGLMYKNDERITLRIKGDGPISSMLVEANSKGEVRGEINNPNVYIKYEDGPKKGKLNVGQAVGKGFIYITKDLNMKEFFTSSAQIQTGEIADDFTYYFVVSEQVPSSVGLGVLVNTDQSVLASGGYILQLMPDASEEVIAHLESVIANLKPISTLIHEGRTPEEIITLLSDGTEQILEKKDLNYVCNCSKEGFAKSLCSLDEQTMRELIDEDEGAEIVCHFCNKKYHFSKAELEDLNTKRKL
ncbi:MAG: Hsp33 family molecular chaperone HslO [Acholeplasmataceae bacterium]|nr:Hsp33 family molecular chaperone HslO [Acholeplasmataceae bacterium]